MSSNALYDAVMAFLDDAPSGAAGDVRTTINAEQPGYMVAGSVTASRSERERGPRKQKVPPLSVAIVPMERWPSRRVGIGWLESDVVLELRATLKLKDLPAGKAQLVKVDNVARALKTRYDGVSNLPIPVAGGLANFVRSLAEVTHLDNVPASSEFSRSVVRTVFTFREQMASNT